MTRTSALYVLGLVWCLASAVVTAGEAQQLSWDGVLDAEHRSDSNRQRDSHRRPLETLSFLGLEPCQVVVELWPGKGWYTEILAPLLRDCGTLYTAHFPVDSEVDYFRRSRQGFDALLARYPQVFDKVKVTTLAPPTALAIAPPASADSVLTFRNVHNWLKAGTAQTVFEAAFKALKPGGVLGVVEHRADPGTSLETMIESGYVSEEKVIALAEAAGFLLLGRSEINANLADDHHHPAGVWTLPPTLRLGEKDRQRYMNIGESDRMTLKFGKPVYE